MKRVAWLLPSQPPLPGTSQPVPRGPSGLRVFGWLVVAYALAATAAFVAGVGMQASGATAPAWLWSVLPGPWAEEVATDWDDGAGPRAFVLGALWATAVVAALCLLVYGGLIHGAWTTRPPRMPRARALLGALAALLILGGVVGTAMAVWHGSAGDWQRLDPFAPLAVAVGVWLAVSAVRGRGEGTAAHAAPRPGAPATVRASEQAGPPARRAAGRPAQRVLPGERGPVVQSRPARPDEVRRR